MLSDGIDEGYVDVPTERSVDDSVAGSFTGFDDASADNSFDVIAGSWSKSFSNDGGTCDGMLVTGTTVGGRTATAGADDEDFIGDLVGNWLVSCDGTVVGDDDVEITTSTGEGVSSGIDTEAKNGADALTVDATG